MTTVFDILEKAEKIDLNYLIPLSLIDSQEEYVILQRDQMTRGLRSDGRPIFNLKTGSASYSPSYSKYKGKKQPIDLLDKGDFQGGIFLHVEGAEKIIVDSADGKSGKLQENYGEQVFGLDDEYQVQFNPIAQEALVNEVELILGK